MFVSTKSISQDIITKYHIAFHDYNVYYYTVIAYYENCKSTIAYCSLQLSDD